MFELKINSLIVGRAKSTFPFVTLKVDENLLELNAGVIGKFVFQPEHVISLEPYKASFGYGQGVKINHCLNEYHDQVIFWTTKNPEWVIAQIVETGFLNKDNIRTSSHNPEIESLQKSGASPIKKSAGIVGVVIWNLLFLIDIVPFLLGKTEGFPAGKGMLAAFALLFTSALLSIISPGFRKLILKPGRLPDDIKRTAIFTMIVAAILFISFSN